MDLVPSSPAAVDADAMDEYDNLDPELDNLIATVTFNQTTGKASDLKDSGIIVHRCRLQVTSQACQTFITTPSYVYDGRGISAATLTRFLDQSWWDSQAAYTDELVSSPMAVSAPSSSVGLQVTLPPAPAPPPTGVDVACVGVQAPSVWWVLTRGVRPGIYSTRLECTAYVLGVPGAVFNVFTTAEEAEGAWAHAQAENFIRIVHA
ncbi:hypothetical protein EIP86_001710 [Pleurotus ostreatoroseus]|nr:hypothetical protein EIP86_001710 [Pleurotus ostreatoroseus]